MFEDGVKGWGDLAPSSGAPSPRPSPKPFSDELTRWILQILLEHPEGVKIAWLVRVYFSNKLDFSNPKDKRKAYQRIYRRIKTLEKHGLVKAVDRIFLF